MKTFECLCGNALFWDNYSCLGCHKDVGFCPNCEEIRSIDFVEEETWQCRHCQAILSKCRNGLAHGVCNWFLSDQEVAAGESLCWSCRLTKVVPDVSKPHYVELWRKLEAAKRRVLYSLKTIQLPICCDDCTVLPLEFHFKASTPEHLVTTGHSAGVITIQLEEADDVQRETVRVQFAEPHRTLVGHFRHELGHYFWDLLIRGTKEVDHFRSVFGDERSPTYEDAQRAYYANGPQSNWPQNFISAYASMHPWEDFAETFNAYLDIVAVLDTAGALRWIVPDFSNCKTMLTHYQKIGLSINEFNREMGLKDLVPEIYHADVRRKIEYLHGVVRTAAKRVDLATQGLMGEHPDPVLR
ncbi:MAG: putative zinc-binding metallopeptidase [Planctomycetaceae bacterium]|nr:putative zinc-binding metallopeptidase [Planctomycetaceae bacterium]